MYFWRIELGSRFLVPFMRGIKTTTKILENYW
jgi:hypothetical protein